MIAVVGATGFTGRLVVAELADRGVAVRLVGRNRARLMEVAEAGDGDVRAVSGWRREDLAAALEGCAAVVSCAGPFIEAGRPVVEAAIDARVPYTDSTGEQAFIREVYERFDAPAHAAGVALAPAFGFDFVPGDLAAEIAAEGLGPLARVDVVYAVEGAESSVGTRRSAVGILAHPGYQRIDGALRAEVVGARRLTVATQFGRRTGGSIPGGEPLMLPRHLQVGTVVGYMALPGRLSPAHRLARLLPLAARLPGASALLMQGAARGSAGPAGAARAAQVACVVQATALDGRRRAVRVEGRDAYGFTARSLAELAVRMRDGQVDAAGARSPAELVEARSFLTATGMTVVEIEPED
ncbi:MAG TPA: NAD(P)H-binding protein [Candidatus Dormibacteraeota bacterium]